MRVDGKIVIVRSTPDSIRAGQESIEVLDGNRYYTMGLVGNPLFARTFGLNRHEGEVTHDDRDRAPQAA